MNGAHSHADIAMIDGAGKPDHERPADDRRGELERVHDRRPEDRVLRQLVAEVVDPDPGVPELGRRQDPAVEAVPERDHERRLRQQRQVQQRR
jgi:hypothetical protein